MFPVVFLHSVKNEDTVMNLLLIIREYFSSIKTIRMTYLIEKMSVYINF